jgi:NADPH2:quinone reductase
MRAIRLHEFGPPSHLVLDHLPDLTPAPEDVRIAVAASGVHLLDTSLRRGEPGPMPAPDLPTIPGREVAGVIDLVGDDVDAGWLGRRVVAHLGLVPGGYAEQAVTTPDRLFPLPDHVDLTDAVAMVGTGRTAQGILELDPVAPGDTILIPAAAGGLGWLLVQAARTSGARVVAAARGGDKLARLKELDPDVLADYGADGWADQVREAVGGVSLVYDGVGGAIGRTSLELLSPGGRLVMFGFSSGTPTQFDTGDILSRGISASWSLGARMQGVPGGIPGLAARALERHAAGGWQPLVTTYPLADAARAHQDLEDRATLGKVVLLA